MEKTDTSQTASRDINNVHGTQYIINNPVFELSGQEGKFDKVELKIKELDRVDYLKQLNKQLVEKKLIRRNRVIQEISNILDCKNEVVVHGDPGVGKTVILNEISIDRDAVYLSIKGKSIDRVLRHLISSFGLSYENRDREGLIDLFEGFLQSSSKFFLIDDCESSPEIVNSLLGIEKFNNKFIYTSRNRSVVGHFQIEEYEVPAFNEDEVLEFLQVNEIEIDDLKLNDLITASQGNPLYLFYFTKYQIKPLPKGLIEYQTSIWRSLSAGQKEVLSCITIAVFPITLNILRDSYISITQKDCSPMVFAEVLSDIDFLFKKNETGYEIFHLSFKEYLLAELTAMGVLDIYKKVVGNTCFNHEQFIDASILLIGIDNEKIKPFLFEGSHILYHSGYLEQSLSLLIGSLSIFDATEELFELGYAHYHLSNIYKDFSENNSANYHVEKALKIFEELGEKKWILAAIAFKALFLAEDGKKNESLELVNHIIENLPEEPAHQALSFVNISKINLFFNQYEDGAKYAKKALEIFIGIEDSQGIQISLLNYSACLANIEEEELATKYLEEMLASESVEISLQVKAGILNNLTSCYRKISNYDKAKEYCIEAIKIARKLGLNNKVAMNLLNLGNVYRDEKDYTRSEKIYKQGLKIAEKCNCNKEIGRAFELIANIYNKQAKYLEAKEAAMKAIRISILVNDDFRIAEAYIEKAYADKYLGLIDEYVEDLSNAVKHYLQEKFYDEAIYYLFKLCNVAHENDLSNIIQEHIELLKEIVDKTVQIDAAAVIENLKESKEIIDNSTALGVIEKVSQINILDGRNANVVFPYIYFITLCKKEFKKRGKDKFDVVLSNIQKNLCKDNNLLNLLACIVEQSNQLLNFREVEIVIENLVRTIEGFYYREVADGSRIFTICWENDVTIQITAVEPDIMDCKLALSISLILIGNEKYLISKIGEPQEKFLEIYVFNQEAFNKKIKEITDDNFTEPVSAVFGERVGYDIPIPIILSKDYMERSDFAINDDNKAFLWIMMNIYQILKSHFRHIPYEEINPKEASHFARTVMFPSEKKGNEDYWKMNFDIKKFVVN